MKDIKCLLRICCVIMMAMSSWHVALSFNVDYLGVTLGFKEIGNEEVSLREFSVQAKIVVVPGVIKYGDKTYRVTRINTFINGRNYMVEELTLEEGVEMVDNYAFNECRNLKSITLPSTLRKIGKNAFRVNAGTIIEAPFDEAGFLAIRKGKSTYLNVGSNNVNSDSYLFAQQNGSSNVNSDGNTVTVPIGSEQSSLSSIKSEPDNLATTMPNVDEAIPITKKVNEKTYCMIIANENYMDVPNVPYAQNDGKIFSEYCQKTLGIPERQIKIYEDATYTHMRRALNWIKDIDAATMGEANFIFYYAGHGIPDEKGTSSYLIPTDGFPSDMSTCFSTTDLYEALGSLKAEMVAVLLDACFSGVSRGQGNALVASRSIAKHRPKDALTGNVIVFSATSDNETALAFDKRQHGLFTYHLLLALRESNGKIKLGDWFSTVSKIVARESILENEKKQTPTINVSPQLQNSWKDIQF